MTPADAKSADSARSRPGRRLRDLHREGEFVVVPNCWDAGSARLLESVGFPTVATSSAALAWSLGYPDGEGARWEDLIAALRRISRLLEIPLSADIEGGFVSSTGGIAETIEAVCEAGAAGVNLEDTDFAGKRGGLVEADEHAELIAGARAEANRLSVPLFINGRTDIYLRGVGDPATRADRTIQRLRLYAEAGADCAFAPGICDPVEIERVASALPVGLNVMRMPGMPPLARLAQLGVRRVSFGIDIYMAALAATERAAADLLRGRTQALEEAGTPSREGVGRVMLG